MLYQVYLMLANAVVNAAFTPGSFRTDIKLFIRKGDTTLSIGLTILELFTIPTRVLCAFGTRLVTV